MRAEEDRRPFGSGLEPAEQVADRGADLRPRVVLVYREGQTAQVPEDLIRHAAFFSRRARHARHLDEQLGDLGEPVCHGP